MGRTWEALYMKHSHGQKVIGQGHKVMRRSSTKTSNISSKCHAVVGMHLSYRKSRSPERMAGPDFWPEVRKQLFLSMRSENRAKNSLTVLSNRHNFSPFLRNRGRWTRWWWQFLDRKHNWRYFSACALKKSPNIAKMYSDKELFFCYWKWGSPKRMERSDFWPEARK